ncbi:uncharacterized protein MKZ38_000628 [Zalerion maritima]|uniref:Uncharacterized protein n=1 Tax=Zalerion maritima TaxID=339359 RepID=A0AAD5RRA1_9PEZI|nr:uncharacterized protein MKZ38_000628 [Zalerion maritima]
MRTTWLHDDEGIPSGLQKIGYDSDRHKWTYKDPTDGSLWEGGPHQSPKKDGMKLSTPRCQQQPPQRQLQQHQQQLQLPSQYQEQPSTSQYQGQQEPGSRNNSEAQTSGYGGSEDGIIGPSSPSGTYASPAASRTGSTFSTVSPTSPYTPISPYNDGQEKKTSMNKRASKVWKSVQQRVPFGGDGAAAAVTCAAGNYIVVGSGGPRRSRTCDDTSVSQQRPISQPSTRANSKEQQRQRNTESWSPGYGQGHEHEHDEGSRTSFFSFPQQKKHPSVATTAGPPIASASGADNNNANALSPTDTEFSYSQGRSSILSTAPTTPATPISPAGGARMNQEHQNRQSKRRALMRPFMRSKDFDAPDDMSGAVDFNNYMDFTRSAGPLRGTPASPSNNRRHEFGGPLAESPTAGRGGFGSYGGGFHDSPVSPREWGRDFVNVNTSHNNRSSVASPRVITTGQPRLSTVSYGQPRMNSVTKDETGVRISVIENPFDDVSDEDVSGRRQG